MNRQYAIYEKSMNQSFKNSLVTAIKQVVAFKTYSGLFSSYVGCKSGITSAIQAA
jgi:hypothetical protein